METVKCSHCNGSGREFASMDLNTGEKRYRTCSVCNGTGSVAAERRYFTKYPDLSLQNALQLMQRHGKPVEICVVRDHDIRVLFKDGSRYMLGGFTVGYRGTGPEYTKRFLNAAGFDISIDDTAAMKPEEGQPITLVAGQPCVALKTVVFHGPTVEEARRIAEGSVPSGARIIAFEVVHHGTTLETTDQIVYTTFDDAFRLAKSHLSERADIEQEKIEDGDSILAEGKASGEGDSEDAALEEARSHLPEGAVIVEKKVLQAGSQGTVVVEAFSRNNAELEIKYGSLKDQLPEGAVATSVECTRQPRSGLLGLGARDGTYEVSWRSPWKVSLIYRRKKIVLTYRPKPTVRITFQSSPK